jgi:hypothetical protein
MRRALTLIPRARCGAAAAEFALILPTVAAMVMGALDFSHAWSTRLGLEQAAQAGIELVAARKGIATNYNYALAEANARWGKPLTSSALDTWLECGGVRQPNLTANCNGAQRARYVSIQLRAEYVPMMGWGSLFNGSTGNDGFIITGDAAVRIQ